MTSRNAPRLVTTGQAAGNDKAQMVLQSDEIVYDRQPVAVVLADTFERAQYAASLFTVHYDVEAPQTTFAMGTPYKPQAVHGQDADHQRGDAVSALAVAAVKVDNVYTTPIEHHNPMEPHATIARWDGDTLVIETKGQFGDSDFTMTQKWTLSADGKTLTVAQTFKSAMGEGDQKMVFEKQ